MPTQVAQVARHLEQGIADGRYVAGRRMPAERTLAEQLAVSRATAREAIGLLVARGVLERRQGDGTYVVAAAERRMAEIWQDMARQHPMLQADLVEFRAMLEGRTAELAALRHDDEDRARLQAAHAAVDAAYGSSDRQAQIRTDVAFHRANPPPPPPPMFSYLIASLLALLHDHVQVSLAGLSPQSPVSQQLRSQHDALLSAILARDAGRARDVASGHMDYVAVQLNALPRISRARTP